MISLQNLADGPTGKSYFRLADGEGWGYAERCGAGEEPKTKDALLQTTLNHPTHQVRISQFHGKHEPLTTHLLDTRVNE